MYMYVPTKCAISRPYRWCPTNKSQVCKTGLAGFHLGDGGSHLWELIHKTLELLDGTINKGPYLVLYYHMGYSLAIPYSAKPKFCHPLSQCLNETLTSIFGVMQCVCVCECECVCVCERGRESECECVCVCVCVCERVSVSVCVCVSVCDMWMCTCICIHQDDDTTVLGAVFICLLEALHK